MPIKPEVIFNTVLVENMAKTKQDKKVFVENLVAQLKESKSAVFTSARGLTVQQIEELRNNCKKEGVKVVSSKKTLLKKALEDLGITDFDPKSYDGLVTIAFGIEDEVAPARIAYDFSKNNGQLQIQDGILAGEFAAQSMVVDLAKLPSKQELQAKFVGTLQGPIAGFNNVLAGNLRGLVQVLNQVREQKAA